MACTARAVTLRGISVTKKHRAKLWDHVCHLYELLQPRISSAFPNVLAHSLKHQGPAKTKVHLLNFCLQMGLWLPGSKTECFSWLISNMMQSFLRFLNFLTQSLHLLLPALNCPAWYLLHHQEHIHMPQGKEHSHSYPFSVQREFPAPSHSSCVATSILTVPNNFT